MRGQPLLCLTHEEKLGLLPLHAACRCLQHLSRHRARDRASGAADFTSLNGCYLYQIADELKLTAKAFSFLINNTKKPSYETIKKIADYFDVTADYLLVRSNIKSPEAKALGTVGLEALKANLDRCAAMNTKLITTMNRLLGNTLINQCQQLKDQQFDLML